MPSGNVTIPSMEGINAFREHIDPFPEGMGAKRDRGAPRRKPGNSCSRFCVRSLYATYGCRRLLFLSFYVGWDINLHWQAFTTPACDGDALRPSN